MNDVSAAHLREGLTPEYAIRYPNVEDGQAANRSDPSRYVADVVVVGSGAGGAPAAARLRDAGFDVLILEEGGLQTTASFTTDTITSLQRLYRDAGTSAILGTPPIMFAEGRCVGGSTVINGGMSWRTPERVLERWRRDDAVDGIRAADMERSFARVERLIS